jgi:integrase
MLIKRGSTWHTRLIFEGKLYQRSLHTKNKATAVNLESAFRTSLIKGEFGIIDGQLAPTLAAFEQRLLPHLKANVASRTYGFYKENLAALNRFPELAQSRLHKIDSSLIEKFIQFRLKQNVAPVTVNHSLRTLRRALILAREWKLIRDVPRIKLLPGEREREFVLDEEVLSLMIEYLQKAYPTSLMQHLLPFLVDTGLRISEACGLQWDHVRLTPKPGSIRIVKGKSKYAKREIPLTERACFALKAASKQSRSSWVFTSKGGRKPLTRHYPSEQFRIIRMALNQEDGCVLHSTRHTFCTRLGKAGADAFTIQKLAGHSSITISQRYVHADREIKEAAIRLLDKLNEPPKIVPRDTIEEI